MCKEIVCNFSIDSSKVDIRKMTIEDLLGDDWDFEDDDDLAITVTRAEEKDPNKP